MSRVVGYQMTLCSAQFRREEILHIWSLRKGWNFYLLRQEWAATVLKLIMVPERRECMKLVIFNVLKNWTKIN